MKKVIYLLENKNIKTTSVRMLVLELLLNTKHAISLADIEDKLPWCDRTTLYRSLKTFEKNTLIHEISDGSKAVKYALCSDTCEVATHHIHPHFHCEKCDKTSCLEEQELVLNAFPKELKINNYSLILNGLCEECNLL